MAGSSASALVWLIGRTIETTRAQRMAAALILLPVLVLLAFEGGWWLIPADLAWLAIEGLDRDADQRAVRSMVEPAGPAAVYKQLP